MGCAPRTERNTGKAYLMSCAYQNLIVRRHLICLMSSVRSGGRVSNCTQTFKSERENCLLGRFGRAFIVNFVPGHASVRAFSYLQLHTKFTCFIFSNEVEYYSEVGCSSISSFGDLNENECSDLSERGRKVCPRSIADVASYGK